MRNLYASAIVAFEPARLFPYSKSSVAKEAPVDADLAGDHHRRRRRRDSDRDCRRGEPALASRANNPILRLRCGACRAIGALDRIAKDNDPSAKAGQHNGPNETRTAGDDRFAEVPKGAAQRRTTCSAASVGPGIRTRPAAG